MREKQVRTLQKGVNTTIGRARLPWRKVKVDGEFGPISKKAARLAGSWQGLSKEQLRFIGEGKITPHIFDTLTHRKPRTNEMKERHRARKKNFAKLRKAHHVEDVDGIADWRGTKVAAWMVGKRKGPDGRRVNWLEKSVKKGWDGRLNSGWRDPAYSESLCYAMCGAPSCPGMCAGKASNHAQIGPPNWGAIDVQQWQTFGRIQKEIGSPLFNALGPADPVHFSPTGR